MLFCTGLLFLATQLPGAHWNLEGQSRSDGVQNIWAVMGRGRARLGTSCQIVPFCWTQTHSVALRFGVTALRPLHAGWAAGRALPLSFLWPRCFCGVSLSLSPASWGSNDCNDETDGFMGERPCSAKAKGAFQRCRGLES